MALNSQKNIENTIISDNHRKINFFLVFSLGLTVIIFSAFSYLLILKESFGSFPLTELIPAENKIRDLFSKKNDIAFLYARSDENGITESRTKKDFDIWRNFLVKSKYNYDIIGPEYLNKKKHLEYSVIIVPIPLYLTGPEAEQLKNFIKTGGSLFVSGEIGIKEAGNTIIGKSFLTGIFNLDFPEEKILSDSVKNNSEDQVSVFRGGLPLTAGIPPGYKMKISGGNLKKAGLKQSTELILISSSGSNKDSNDFLCTAACGRYVKGRFIWTGFRLGGVGPDEDRMILEKFLSNSIRWLLNKPIAFIRSYPGGHNAAAVIAPVLSDSAKNIYNVLKILSNENIKASFFINPETSIENLELIANLNKYGETGVYFENSGSNDLINKLRRSKENTELISGVKCRGCIFSPAMKIELASDLVERAGFDYLLTQQSITYNPKCLFFEGRKFALFESPIYKYKSADTAGNQVYTAYRKDIDSIFNLNDIYVFRFLIDDNDQVKILESIIQYLKKKNFLISTFSKVQERFDQIQNIEINAERKGGRRVFLHLSNNGKSRLDDVSVEIDLNAGPGIKGLYINPEFVSARQANTVDITSKGLLSLDFKNLNPGISLHYFIDYDSGNI